MNALNAGGRIQTLSRQEGPGGDLLIGFEDQRLLDGDGDFNDLVLRLSTLEIA